LTNFALTTKLPTLLVSNWSIGFLALAALTKHLKIIKLLAKKAEFTNPSIDSGKTCVFFLLQFTKDLEFVEVL
jgi:hypothetical protein